MSAYLRDDQDASYYHLADTDINCYDVVRHFNFNRGKAIQAVWRSKTAPSTEVAIEDLRTAQAYLQDEIALLTQTLDTVPPVVAQA